MPGRDNCGSIFSQTFSYDPFGNITKTGTQSFQPTYNSSTNQMTLIGSNTPTYDSNGNVTNDFLNTYAWDNFGRPSTVNGVGATYDALGRMVEQNRSGTYTQIVYSPAGFKLELMNGSSSQKAFVPLPAGAAAVYNSSGMFYRHADWLGSSRLTSTTTRTVSYDGAYGPFGEQYANSGTTDLSFTGMNQDTSSNVYDFAAREYGIQGRWPSPDPSGIASVHIKDPQTWNRYAYVRNNPLAVTDPLGLDAGGCEARRAGPRGAARLHAADEGCGDNPCNDDPDICGGGGGGDDSGGGGGNDCSGDDPSCGDPSSNDCNDPSCEAANPNQPDPSDPGQTDPTQNDPSCTDPSCIGNLPITTSEEWDAFSAGQVLQGQMPYYSGAGGEWTPLTPGQVRCAAYGASAGGLATTGLMNEGAAAATGEVSPFSAIFHGIALVEGIGAGYMTIKAAFACVGQ